MTPEEIVADCERDIYFAAPREYPVRESPKNVNAWEMRYRAWTAMWKSLKEAKA